MKTNPVKRVLLLVVVALLSTQFFAQNSFEISGKIVKSDNPGGNYASVILLDAKTMEIVAEKVCNENGEFVIENVKKGEYVLMVQKPGFKKPEKSLITINENGTIIKTEDIALQNANKETNNVNIN